MNLEVQTSQATRWRQCLVLVISCVGLVSQLAKPAAAQTDPEREETQNSSASPCQQAESLAAAGLLDQAIAEFSNASSEQLLSSKCSCARESVTAKLAANATALLKVGQLTEAQEALNKGLTLEPSSAWLLRIANQISGLELAKSIAHVRRLRSVGKPQEARTALSVLNEKHPNATALLQPDLLRLASGPGWWRSIRGFALTNWIWLLELLLVSFVAWLLLRRFWTRLPAVLRYFLPGEKLLLEVAEMPEDSPLSKGELTSVLASAVHRLGQAQDSSRVRLVIGSLDELPVPELVESAGLTTGLWTGLGKLLQALLPKPLAINVQAIRAGHQGPGLVLQIARGKAVVASRSFGAKEILGKNHALVPIDAWLRVVEAAAVWMIFTLNERAGKLKRTVAGLGSSDWWVIAHHRLGVISFDTEPADDRKQSRFHFGEALEIESDYRPSRINLARVLHRSAPDEAILQLEHALDCHNDKVYLPQIPPPNSGTVFAKLKAISTTDLANMKRWLGGEPSKLDKLSEKEALFKGLYNLSNFTLDRSLGELIESKVVPKRPHLPDDVRLAIKALDRLADRMMEATHYLETRRTSLWTRITGESKARRNFQRFVREFAPKAQAVAAAVQQLEGTDDTQLDQLEQQATASASAIELANLSVARSLSAYLQEDATLRDNEAVAALALLERAAAVGAWVLGWAAQEPYFAWLSGDRVGQAVRDRAGNVLAGAPAPAEDAPSPLAALPFIGETLAAGLKTKLETETLAGFLQNCRTPQQRIHLAGEIGADVASVLRWAALIELAERVSGLDPVHLPLLRDAELGDLAALCRVDGATKKRVATLLLSEAYEVEVNAEQLDDWREQAERTRTRLEV